VAALVQTTDDFFEQMGEDLAAYAQHAGRRGIEEADVLALMRRYVFPFCLSVYCTIAYVQVRLYSYNSADECFV
jgi:hypothetical protein